MIPAGPSRVVLLFAHLSICASRILCSIGGGSIVMVNSVDETGVGTSLSRLKSAIANATASACTRAASYVKETAQRPRAFDRLQGKFRLLFANMQVQFMSVHQGAYARSSFLLETSF